MDFLKDPKNQPIIVVVLIVVILGAVGGVWFMNSRGSGGGPAATTPGMDASAPPGSSPGGPPSPAVPPGAVPAGAPAPGAAPAGAPPSGTAAAQPGAPGAKPVTVAKLEEARPDPFLPFGWKPPVETPPVIRIPMPGRLFPPTIDTTDLTTQEPEPPQPPRRMAGILFKDRVYAILESSGPAGASTMVVKPGDITDDGMRVERIEPTKIILETTNSKTPRRVEVQMAPSQRQPDMQSEAQPGGPPSPYTPYGRPGAPRGPYGPRPGAPVDYAPM